MLTVEELEDIASILKEIKVGDPVWVESGGVGWSVGEVIGYRLNRRKDLIFKVAYQHREGERLMDQLHPRDPALNGADKPPSRGRDRRVRCKECHSLDGHFESCKIKPSANQYPAGSN